MKLNVGIIGLGTAWDSWYAPALWALEDQLRIAAIYDPIAARAEQAVRELSRRGRTADQIDGFRALIRREDIDAVLILSDLWISELPILAALESAKAIYTSLFDRNSIWNNHWQQEIPVGASTILVPELPLRHAPATLRLKELIATQLGPPCRLECYLPMADAPAGRFPNPGTPKSMQLHYVDWCLDIMDREPTSVVGQADLSTQEHGPDNREHARLQIDLDFSAPGNPGTGLAASLRWDGSTPPTEQEPGRNLNKIDFHIACVQGTADITLPDKLAWSGKIGHHSEHLERDRPIHQQLLMHFHQALTDPRVEFCGLEDCYQAIEIVRLAEMSQTSGDRMQIGPESSGIISPIIR